MGYDLVIFDNDGVLVDSEPLANRILAGYLTEIGHPTTYDESLRDYMGGAVHRVHDLVLQRTGQRLPEDFDEMLHSRTFEAFARELRPVDGVEEVLGALTAKGVAYCLASSGSHERIRVGHRAAGIDGWFEEEWIFSSQDVGRGKPAPDLFLHAAERMGVEPAAVRGGRGQPARGGGRRGRGDGRVRVHRDDARRPAGRGEGLLRGDEGPDPLARPRRVTGGGTGAAPLTRADT